MKTTIYKILRKITCFEGNFNDETTLTEIGMNSIEFITFIIAIEEEFNIRFEDMQLIYDRYKTVGDLVKVIIKLQ